MSTKMITLLTLLLIIQFSAITTTKVLRVKDYGKPLTQEFRSLYKKISLDSVFTTNGFILKDPIDNEMKIFSFNSNGTLDLFADRKMRQYKSSTTFKFSPNMDSVLIYQKKPAVFRYSFKTAYEIREYNKESRKVGDSHFIGSEGEELDLVVLSKRKGRLAFCKDHQIYYYDNIFANPTKFIQASPGPLMNETRYGITDWLYEEEILRSNKAAWWSPNAENLAFARFNLSNVSKQKINKFNAWDTETLEGDSFEFYYPKAGEERDDNTPVVDLFIHHVEKNVTRLVEKPEYIMRNAILSHVEWYDEDHLMTIWLDREQIFQDNSIDGWSPLLITENEHPFIDRIGKFVYIIFPKRNDPRQFRGIGRIKIDFAQTSYPNDLEWILWPGYDVDQILHIDHVKKEIFFISSGKKTEESHLFWHRDTNDEEREPVCLSCGNDNCTYSTFEMQPEAGIILQNCLGPVYLGLKVIKITPWLNPSSKKIVLNQTIVNTIEPTFNPVLSDYAVPKRRFMQLEIRPDKPDALNVTAEVVVPPDLDENQVAHYPLLLFTYGGPVRRFVRAEYKFRKPDWISASLKAVVLIVDGRGTSGRGKAFENELYKRLGEVEIQDQLDAVKAFLDISPFINRSHVAAYGWSYGGFTVGHLLSHPENVNSIKCGISVAPVTDFRFYNTAYAERFLGRYHTNQRAYYRTSIIEKARLFKNKKFLIVHGMADDNVHFIQSTKLVAALLKHQIDFDYLFYPDERHGMLKATNHLHMKTEEFLKQCFNITSTNPVQ